MMQKAVTLNELALKLVEDGVTTYFRIDDPVKFHEECAGKRASEWSLYPKAEDLKTILHGYEIISEEFFERAKKYPNPVKLKRPKEGLEYEMYKVKSWNGGNVLAEMEKLSKQNPPEGVEVTVHGSEDATEIEPFPGAKTPVSRWSKSLKYSDIK